MECGARRGVASVRGVGRRRRRRWWEWDGIGWDQGFRDFPSPSLMIRAFDEQRNSQGGELGTGQPYLCMALDEGWDAFGGAVHDDLQNRLAILFGLFACKGNTHNEWQKRISLISQDLTHLRLTIFSRYVNRSYNLRQGPIFHFRPRCCSHNHVDRALPVTHCIVLH